MSDRQSPSVRVHAPSDFQDYTSRVDVGHVLQAASDPDYSPHTPRSATLHSVSADTDQHTDASLEEGVLERLARAEETVAELREEVSDLRALVEALQAGIRKADDGTDKKVRLLQESVNKASTKVSDYQSTIGARMESLEERFDTIVSSMEKKEGKGKGISSELPDILEEDRSVTPTADDMEGSEHGFALLSSPSIFRSPDRDQRDLPSTSKVSWSKSPSEQARPPITSRLIITPTDDGPSNVSIQVRSDDIGSMLRVMRDKEPIEEF